jgi:hypothetical protein
MLVTVTVLSNMVASNLVYEKLQQKKRMDRAMKGATIYVCMQNLNLNKKKLVQGRRTKYTIWVVVCCGSNKSTRSYSSVNFLL